ncbi:MAG: hypothetical protein NT155_02800 [Candidatus Staskawiczbacteria bacterium]|nr:hypothetical protein [Candidatus Staskawiczbacteria bacterium]
MPEYFEHSQEEISEQETVAIEQVDQWNTKGYRVEKHGDNFSVIILGEGHNNEALQAKQIELIKLIKPKYVLHEFLTGWIYNPETKKCTRQENRIIGSEERPQKPADKIITAADEMGFEIIGCDLTETETNLVIDKVCERNPNRFHYDENVKAFFPNKGVEELTNFSPEIIAFRDKKMADTIIEYQKKSKKPIVVVMGSDHGKGIHKNKILQRAGINYAFINQAKIAQKK